MTAIPNISANAPQKSAGDGFAKKQLSPEDFITLFLAQLTKQNPLHPADSSTILQQMAEISSISSAKETKEALLGLQKSMSQTMGNASLFNATQLIGKKVQVESGMSSLEKDSPLSGSVLLPGPGQQIKVTIKNAHGEIVKELNLDDTTSAGMTDFSWDGVKSDNTKAEEGFYHIAATAIVNGKEITLPTLGAFKVKSVAANHATGEVVLNVDGLGGIGINDVIKIL